VHIFSPVKAGFAGFARFAPGFLALAAAAAKLSFCSRKAMFLNSF